ncbi:MAG: hypothetical protein MHM6MM_001848 [Cercozoa sp. M6MM]
MGWFNRRREPASPPGIDYNQCLELLDLARKLELMRTERRWRRCVGYHIDENDYKHKRMRYEHLLRLRVESTTRAMPNETYYDHLLYGEKMDVDVPSEVVLRSMNLCHCDICRKDMRPGEVRYHSLCSDNFDVCPECFEKYASTFEDFADEAVGDAGRAHMRRLEGIRHRETDKIALLPHTFRGEYFSTFDACMAVCRSKFVRDALKRAFVLYKNRPFVGWPSPPSVTTIDTSRDDLRVCTWISYSQCAPLLQSLAQNLRQIIGMPRKSICVICLPLSVEAVLFDMACALSRIISTQVNAAGGTDLFRHALAAAHSELFESGETQLRLVVCLRSQESEMRSAMELAGISEDTNVTLLCIDDDAMAHRCGSVQHYLDCVQQCDEHDFRYLLRRHGDSAFDFESEEVGMSAEALAQETAFVVFTSGSTGLPKGAVYSEAAFANATLNSTPRTFFVWPSLGSLALSVKRRVTYYVALMGGRTALALHDTVVPHVHTHAHAPYTHQYANI